MHARRGVRSITNAYMLPHAEAYDTLPHAGRITKAVLHPQHVEVCQSPLQAPYKTPERVECDNEPRHVDHALDWHIRVQRVHSAHCPLEHGIPRIDTGVIVQATRQRMALKRSPRTEFMVLWHPVHVVELGVAPFGVGRQPQLELPVRPGRVGHEIVDPDGRLPSRIHQGVELPSVAEDRLHPGQCLCLQLCMLLGLLPHLARQLTCVGNCRRQLLQLRQRQVIAMLELDLRLHALQGPPGGYLRRDSACHPQLRECGLNPARGVLVLQSLSKRFDHRENRGTPVPDAYTALQRVPRQEDLNVCHLDAVVGERLRHCLSESVAGGGLQGLAAGCGAQGQQEEGTGSRQRSELLAQSLCSPQRREEPHLHDVVLCSAVGSFGTGRLHALGRPRFGRLGTRRLRAPQPGVRAAPLHLTLRPS
mmetsp:Transcript_82316/g.266800  ORF Transcript_82316/g.266800 Transcript_82316/m.266800 type:complete len:420 (+) Transcript_82316:671-1930(+)